MPQLTRVRTEAGTGERAEREARWNRRDLLALAGLGALCLFYFWPLLTPDAGQRLYIVAGDFTDQFYPYHFFAASEWWARRVPLWNPYMFGGHPFQADIQTAVFYPLSLVVNLLAGRDGLPFLALEAQGVADYLLAAAFSYLFARSVLRDRWAAFLAAVCYALGGFLTSYPFQQLAILETAAWLPLVLYFVERGAGQVSHTKARRPRMGAEPEHPNDGERDSPSGRPIARELWWAAAGLAMAVAILGGHPQSAMFLGYAGLAYLLFRAKSAGTSWPVALRGAAIFLIVAAGGAAVQLLPTFQLTELSTRATMSYAVAAAGYDYLSLPGLLMPLWRGEKALYLGVVPLLLGILAVARGRRPAICFWAAVALVALVLSLGDRGFLFRIFHAVVPGFGIFKGQERIALLFSFAGAMLAAYGLRDLRQGRLPISIRALATVTLALSALAVLGAAIFWSQNDTVGGATDWSAVGFPKLLFLLLLGCGLLALSRAANPGTGSRHSHLAAAAPFVLVLLAGVDLLAANWHNNMSPVSPQLGGAQRAVLGFLGEQQRREGEPLRVRPQNADALPANYGAISRVPLAEGDSPIVVARTEELFRSTEEWRLWQLLNVKYAVSFEQASEALEPVFDAPPLKVYRNRFSLPRAWVVGDVRVASNPIEASAMVLDSELHPGKTAVLEDAPRLSFRATAQDEQSIAQRISFDYYSPRRLFIRTKTDRDGLLVLSEIYYPGWQAKLDGTAVPIYRANYILRGVELPSGEHQLEMVYDPRPFWLGLAISCATFGIVAVALGIRMLGPRLAQKERVG